jgi:DNA-binding transcriptional ArsR family regulator
MATLPHPVPGELAELIATRLRVIGDPTRIRILDALRGGELSVGEIKDMLDTSQQNASKHLGVLNGAGIVERRKEGTTAYYRVVDVAVFELCELVCGALQEQLSQLTTLMEVTR